MEQRIASQEGSDFYARPSAMSAPGSYAHAFAGLPAEVSALAGIVQGLAVHEFAAGHYGVTLNDERRSESHIRPLEQRIERLLELDARPLTEARPPQRRVVGVCHQFALLMTSMLRAKGVPARSRCGFAAYLNPGWYEDHWVCEYRDQTEGRWKLVDAQLDENWEVGIEDPLDVPRDGFLVAADAWQLCRRGQADPARFGIFRGELRGLWFIAGSLVRDLAALNKVEMLPWDVWGAMPEAGQELDEEQLSFFDALAVLTTSPDGSFAELRRRYESDDRLRVPETVFNAVLLRPERVGNQR